MKKLSALFLSLSMVFTALPYNVNVVNTSLVSYAEEVYYKVKEVVDGDTIKIEKDGKDVTVRLLQVDTPESKHPNKNKNVPMGKTATEFTEKLLKDKSVRLEYDVEKTDKYGRDLAYVFVKDEKGKEICVNQALIENSLAKTVKYGKNVKNYEKYLEIERKLRDKKQGIWENIEANYPSNKPTAQEQKEKAKANNFQTPKQVQNTQNTQQKTTTTPTEKQKIKGNKNSMIYHVPGGQSYDKVSEKNAVYFETEEEAVNAGYRRAKR